MVPESKRIHLDPACPQVPRLQGVVRDRRANWAQSIAALRAAKAAGARVTKTSIMLGCGEAAEEVLEAMRLLRDAGRLYFPVFCPGFMHLDVCSPCSSSWQRRVVCATVLRTSRLRRWVYCSVPKLSCCCAQMWTW